MPILSLGAVQPTLVEQWKADLVAGWKKTFDQTFPIYGKGLVESTSGTWNEIYAILTERHAFTHPHGEIPDSLAQEWRKGWEASVTQDPMKINGTIPGFLQYGRWNSVFGTARHQYLDGQVQKEFNAFAQDAATLYIQAKRAAAKLNLDIYGAILRDHKAQLSSQEKQTLDKFFVDWQRLKSDEEKNQVTQILTRIGFVHSTPESIQKQLHDVFIAAGGKEEDWMKASTMEQVISNGSANPITAVDWNQQQANQQVVTELKDGSYVSPLNTMYLNKNREIVVPSESEMNTASTKTNPLILAGLAFFAWKLLRR